MINPKVTAATAYGFSVMFIYGVAVVMIGTLLPEMISDFDLSLSRGGLIVTLQSVGGLVVLGLGIGLADRLPKAVTILVSFGSLGILLLATGLAWSYVILLAAFLLSGIALRILDTMLNAFIGDIRVRRRGFYMNLLHMCFGIGAFCGPLFASAVMATGGSWRSAYYVIAVVFGVAFIPGLFILRRFGSGGGADDDTAGGRDSTERDPVARSDSTLVTRAGGGEILLAGSGLIPAGLGLFFYGMHQSGVTAWLPYYMGAALGSAGAVASGALSIYWAGIILSRVSASRLSGVVGPGLLIMIGALSGGVFLGMGLLSSIPIVVMAACLLSGVLSGATIPLFLTLIHDRHPNNTGMTTAVLMLFMLAGRLIAPWMMGAIADSGSPKGAMLVTVAASLLCGMMAAVSRRG